MTEPKPTYTTETERVNTLEFELDRLITMYLRTTGENNRLRAEIAELRDGHPGDQPPVVGDGMLTSEMKLVLTNATGYRLAHWFPRKGAWMESWTMARTLDVVTWWDLPGGTK